MTDSGRLLSILFLILTATIHLIHAEGEVLFYSPSERLMEESRLYFQRNKPSTRSYNSLTGKYDLHDGETGHLLGQISVPSVYFTKHPFSFRKTLRFSAQDSLHYLLKIERVTGYVVMQLNGDTLFQGSRNFLPLEIPIPAHLLNAEDNDFKIGISPWTIESGMYPHWIPVNLPRLNNGIAGYFSLEEAPSLYIKDFMLKSPVYDDGVTLSGEIVLERSGRTARNFNLLLEFLDAEGEKARFQTPVSFDSTDLQIRVPFTLGIEALLNWSPENPVEYSLRARIFRGERLFDELSRQVALRQVAFRDNELVMNQETTRVAGLNYIYQDARGAGLFDRSLILKDLKNLKEKGFNAIRLGYYPQNPRFYELTDSLGILCFQDLPFPYFTVDILSDSGQVKKFIEYAEEFRDIALQHPSVIGIGLGSFFTDSRTMAANDLAALHDMLSAGGHFLIYSTSFDPASFSGDLVDFICLNLLERNRPEQSLEKLLKGNFPHKPVFLSAFSKPMSYRIDSSRMTYDIRQIGELYRITMHPEWKNRFAGQFLFTYSDYFLQFPSIQAGMNRADGCQINRIGLFTLDRALKEEAGSVLKHRWGAIQEEETSFREKEAGSYIFIIVGLLDLFLFLFIYRSYIDFRKNIIRSIRRPHGFFVELLERRLISYEQSLILMFVISLNAAVMLGGIFYFFRNNLLLDFALSLLMPAATVKMYICQIIWQPLFLVPVLVFVVAFLFVVLTVPIWFLSMVRRTRIRFRQALATSTWSASPFLLLLPFGMFFYNLLLVMNSYWILLLVLLYFHVWYFLRWLNGTRVMAVWTYPRVLIYSLLLLVMTGGGVFWFLQQKEDLFLHLNVWTQLLYFHF